MKTIISNFEVHHTYFIILRDKVWSSADRANLVKYVLGKRFNSLRDEKKKKDLPEEAKEEIQRKNSYATRKSQVRYFDYKFSCFAIANNNISINRS